MIIKYSLSRNTDVDKFIDYINNEGYSFSVSKTDEDHVVYVKVAYAAPMHLLIVGANLALAEVQC